MLNRTALFAEHQKLGGRLVEFGGWELPIQYRSVLEEHTSCRTAAGLFDVSHMGELLLEGEDAEAFLNFCTSNDVSKLADGQAQYTVMCDASGGIVDDLVIYRRSRSRFLLVVNASNTQKDFAHLNHVLTSRSSELPRVKLEDASSQYTQIAIQGPRAAEILSEAFSLQLNAVKTYWFLETTLSGQIPAVVARTGYTGEDGFELYVPWDKGPEIWNHLLAVGAPKGLAPCGLGARDTLRLEMKYPLYGNELSLHTHPLEAGLGWVVKLGKSDFIGKQALVQFQQEGLKRKLVGIQLLDKGIPRHGYPILDSQQKPIGELTSGSFSPSLKTAIGIGYVDIPNSSIGTSVFILIRGTPVAAKVVATPFYQKKSK